MARYPTNNDDTIDSRDVIAAIDELEAKIEERWTLTWREAPHETGRVEVFTDESEARDLIHEMAVALSDRLNDEGKPDDAREILDLTRAIQVDSGEDTFIFGPYTIMLTRSEVSTLDDDEKEELRLLMELDDQADYVSDWRYGATLVRETYFKEYAMQFADDIGAIPRDVSWPCDCIDWDRAARELRMDYTCIEFDGVTYYVR